MKTLISRKEGYFPLITAVICSLLATSLWAQDAPRDGTPIHLDRIEGQWVAIVNEDWLWRMKTPDKGDFTSIPYNARAREVGNEWDPSMDGSCLAYGAAGIMRQPMRIRVDWESDSVIRLQTDYGQQTRRFIFNQPPAANTQNSLQGYSLASWKYDAISGPAGAFAGGGAAANNGPRHGSLKVETTHLIPAWLRNNGAPVSGNARVTEYYDVFEGPGGIDWLVATVVVSDPEYLNTDFVTSSHFRRETDRSGWDPQPCNPL